MVSTWQRELHEKIEESARLTPVNRLVLAYQFSEARSVHPEGFTMDLDGQLYTAHEGYAVGMTPISFHNAGDALDTLAAIQEKWGFHNLYLGFWHDEERDYIDVTMVTSSFNMAMALGKVMRQVAVWSFADDHAIRLDDERWMGESVA